MTTLLNDDMDVLHEREMEPGKSAHRYEARSRAAV